MTISINFRPPIPKYNSEYAPGDEYKSTYRLTNRLIAALDW